MKEQDIWNHLQAVCKKTYGKEIILEVVPVVQNPVIYGELSMAIRAGMIRIEMKFKDVFVARCNKEEEEKCQES